MKASIYSNTTLIGHADLQISDESMGCVYGNFIPTEDYYKLVQKTVWQFWASDKPDYYQWSLLRINAQLENGYFLYPIGGYTFEDAEELPNEPKRIDIAGLFRHVIDDFFKKDSPQHFIEDPWEIITIEEKLSFEDELQKEIKKKSNFFARLFKVSTNHILANYSCSAICKSGQADDVLFSIHNNVDPDKNFALVHLTYSGKTEDNPIWPSTMLFGDFNDFKLATINRV